MRSIVFIGGGLPDYQCSICALTKPGAILSSETLKKNSERSKEWLSQNREYRRNYNREWRARAKERNPEKYIAQARKYALKYYYNITPEEYDTILLRQNGHCAICTRTPDSEVHKILNVDHCHATGKVRGLLCSPCNRAIGILGDTEAGIEKALFYLRGATNVPI